MDLLKLARVGSEWQITDIVEGHSSFIWTSRFIDAGEFEYRTYKVNEVFGLLPEGTMVKAEDGDDEVMMVTSRVIEPTSEGPQLVVKGKAFETILEERAQYTGDGWEFGAEWTFPAYFIMLLIFNRAVKTPQWSDDIIPGVDATTVITRPEDYDDETFVFDPKSPTAYANMLDVMKRANLGIYCAHAAEFPESDLYFIIHDGRDRTVNQTVVEPVILSVEAGQLTDPKYVFGNEQYKNVAYVNAPIGFVKTSRYGTAYAGLYDGLERRVLQVNADDLTEVPAGMTAEQVLDQRGRIELAKANLTTLFDGNVVPSANFKYQRDYFMGDLITVVPEYSRASTPFKTSVKGKPEPNQNPMAPPVTMQVTEYIRSSSPAGDLEFPTLTQVI